MMRRSAAELACPLASTTRVMALKLAATAAASASAVAPAAASSCERACASCACNASSLGARAALVALSPKTCSRSLYLASPATTPAIEIRASWPECQKVQASTPAAAPATTSSSGLVRSRPGSLPPKVRNLSIGV